jgi:hypothetical protein
MRLVVGRTRSACDLVSQYMAPSLYSALLAKYECVQVVASFVYPFTYVLRLAISS